MENSITASKTNTYKSLAALLFVALFVFLGMYRLQPPKALPANANPVDFSAKRAMTHINTAFQQPHPPGSPEHARVREYILSEFSALGLDPQVQETEVMRLRKGQAFDTVLPWGAIGEVKNIVVRLRGTDNSKAILIGGHYDSMATGPGASDGGSCVAIALETARALTAGPPLKNDVIFLLTDIEEHYLLGSKAFIDQHPWAQDIGLMLHSVARGTSGPSIMFETSPENGWLIEQLAKVTSHTIANSLAYEVYKLMPNDTDFTEFRKIGVAGLNFAYIDDPANYHLMLDNPENLDERSLQHQGSQILALARRFGDLNLENIKKKDVVYFDLLGLTIVHYPEDWVPPLMFLAIVIYVGVIALGLKKKQLTFIGFGLGTLAPILTLIGAFVTVTLLGRAILALHDEYRWMYLGNLYNSPIYLISFVAFTIALTSFFYVLLAKKMRLQNLIAGQLSTWLILVMLTSTSIPGASYLFLWPTVFSLLALGFVFLSKSQDLTSWQNSIVFSLCAIPGLILVVPTTYLMYIALPPLQMGGQVVAIMVALLLGMLTPHLTLISKPKTWSLPVITAMIGVTFVIIGSLTASFNTQRPRQVSVGYGLIVDIEGTEKAYWLSTASPDEWSSQFFPDQFSHGYDPFAEAVGQDPYYGADLFTGPAPVVPAPMPNVVVLEDHISNGVRKLRLGFSAPQPALQLGVNVLVEPDTLLSAKVNGTDLEGGPEAWWVAFMVFFYSPASEERFEMSLETTSSQPVKVYVGAAYYGFPKIPSWSFEPRPAHTILSPKDLALLDTTIVQKVIEFPTSWTKKKTQPES